MVLTSRAGSGDPRPTAGDPRPSALAEGGRESLAVVEPVVIDDVFPPKTPDPFSVRVSCGTTRPGGGSGLVSVPSAGG